MQLDLFSKASRQGTAVVFHFPMARRANEVRAAARHLLSRSYEDGRRFWSSHIQSVRRRLKEAGLSRSEIDQEIVAYSRAVRNEACSSLPGRIAQ